MLGCSKPLKPWPFGDIQLDGMPWKPFQEETGLEIQGKIWLCDSINKSTWEIGSHMIPELPTLKWN